MGLMAKLGVNVGEVLYFYPEEMPVLVVITGDDGFRYINPMKPEFDNNGNVKTTYVSYAAISEWTTSLGSITNISATLMGKKSQ
jgi:hypothetical protein